MDRENDWCAQYFREFDSGDFSTCLNSDPRLKLPDLIGLTKLHSNKRLGLFTSSGSGMRQHFLMSASVHFEGGGTQFAIAQFEYMMKWFCGLYARDPALKSSVTLCCLIFRHNYTSANPRIGAPVWS